MVPNYYQTPFGVVHVYCSDQVVNSQVFIVIILLAEEINSGINPRSGNPAVNNVKLTR